MADEKEMESDEQVSGTLALDSNKQKEFEDKIKNINTQDEELTPGVIYLGHIPHGFYEDQMRAFFSQFGTVTKVRLARSKKTTRSKGYAFVEFACDEVAKIVAETMHNYMMFGRLLKCNVIPQERIHPRLWKGSNRKFRFIPHKKNEITRQNKPKSGKEYQKNISNILSKERRKRGKLKALGIDYEFPGYREEAKVVCPKHKRFAEND